VGARGDIGQIDQKYGDPFLRRDKPNHYLHMLGYYDHVNPPQVLPTRNEQQDIDSIALHEEAHQWIAERSIVGNVINLLVLALIESKEHDPEVVSLIECLAKESEEVQEGFATYTEFLSLGPSVQIGPFRAQLGNKESVYLRGFNCAHRINSIISSETFPGHSEGELGAIRHSLLLDISRFAMNVPIRLEGSPTGIASYMRINSANKRWKTIMRKLVENASFRSELISSAQQMFETWLQKSRRRFDGESYGGITYGDNVEQVIAKMFPSLPYKDVVAWRREHQLPVTSYAPEAIEDYLLRETTSELQFETWPALPKFRDVATPDLVDQISQIDRFPDRACYIRLAPNQSDSEDRIERNINVAIPPGSVCVILHEAHLTVADQHRRWWNYIETGVATVIPASEVPEILGAARSLDSVVVVDCDLEVARPFAWAFGWADLKTPIMIKTTPTGSFSSLASVLKDGDVLAHGAELFAMSNWDHFVGAGNRQVKLLWIIPQKMDGRISVAVFATMELLKTLGTWREKCRPPQSLVFLSGIETIEVWGSAESTKLSNNNGDRWSICETDGVIWAPANTDVATSHIQSFGW
jgi:hypothetical protein